MSLDATLEAPSPSGPPGTAHAALEVDDVSVHFGGVVALESVSLRVETACITGLIGPNGAGKTTLFNVVSGLQRPRHGTVRLHGVDIRRRNACARAKLGLARTFQRLEVFGSLTVAENLQVAAESSVRRARRRGADPVSVRELLERLRLVDVATKRANTLSTGVTRMVELGRAIATSPTVLLLDEPSSGLDEGESAFLEDVLRDLAAGGLAVLLVEHDVDLVMRSCQRIFVLDFGRIIATGSAEAVRADPKVQAAYLGDMDGD